MRKSKSTVFDVVCFTVVALQVQLISASGANIDMNADLGKQAMKGYGGQDGDQDGYRNKFMEQMGTGGDNSQEGYASAMQSKVAAAKGLDLKKPLCPTGTTLVPKKDYQVGSDGQRAFTAYQHHKKYDFRRCGSYIMDACLQCCGITPAKCLAFFEECTKEECATKHSNDKACSEAGTADHRMYEMTMAITHRESQTQACECVSDEKALVKRTERLIDFYYAYAQDQAEKIPSVLKKYSGSRRFATLWFSLHKKYTEAVKVHVVSEEEHASRQKAVPKKMSQDDKDKTARKEAIQRANEDAMNQLRENLPSGMKVELSSQRIAREAREAAEQKAQEHANPEHQAPKPEFSEL